MSDFNSQDIKWGNGSTFYEFCSYCDLELDNVDNRQRRPSRFCCDDHATKYHNERRRLLRMKKRATSAIEALLDFISEHDGSELKGIALEGVSEVLQMARAAQEKVHWQCSKCGQIRYILPYENEACAFCQSKNTFKMKAG